MKIVQKNKPFENWTLNVDCNGLHWNQNGKVPCGSTLEINTDDLIRRKWFKYPNNEGVNYGFICPVCQCFTEIKDSELSDNLKIIAKDYV